MSVFVVGLNGTRLMPTSERQARLLLKNGRAVIYKKQPFTIRLAYKTGSTIQPLCIGIDTGSQHIGVAVSTDREVLYACDIELRSSMEKRKLMELRKTYRRGRRYRKTPYRHPKFRFHTKRVYSETADKNGRHWHKVKNSVNTDRPEGWLPPSIQSKVDHHIRWINAFMDVLPRDTRLNIEIGRFDMARMKNPDIHNELYQRGPMYDMENVRAYVFARDNYTCQICKKKGGKLHVHHIDYRSEGATDNPERMATVCTDCHTPENHKPGGILYQWMVNNKRFARGYRDASFMNILRKRIFKAFPSATFTYGNITRADRIEMGLSKSHINDAIAIAMLGTDAKPAISCQMLKYKQVRRKKRSLHEANPRRGRKVPNREAKRNSKNTKQIKNVCLYDRVKVNGKTGWVTGFTGTSCRIVDKEGCYITVSDKYTQVPVLKVRVLHHCNNWLLQCV